MTCERTAGSVRVAMVDAVDHEPLEPVVNISSKESMNWLARSRTSARGSESWWPYWSNRFRAAWVAQTPVGWSVIPGIGYVTPNDEHTGRGEQIRQGRIKGLRRAHQQRLDYHRLNHHHNNPQEPI